MKKRLLSLLVVFTLVFSITACGQTKPNSNTDNSPEINTEINTDINTEETSAAITQYPITVTDQAGREVTIESEPQKLVSGYYISTSLLIALDLDENLVGVESNAQKRTIYKLCAPKLNDLPSVGTVKEIDLEGCVALEPDLVILPLKLKHTAESFDSLNIDVFYVNPESQDLLKEMISIIGTATNTQEKANTLINFITKQENLLTTTLANADAPSVYLAGNSNMLSTASSAMYQSSMIELAGGKNVAADIIDTYWVEISYEQLLTWNPEYIILASDASYTIEDVLTDPNLAECSAIKNGNVYQIPYKVEAWDSPVPSGILGSVWLATILHDDLFSDAEASAIIDEYYETFYNFTYSEK